MLAALDQVARRAGARRVRVRRRPTRTSTPPSSAGSPSSPAPAGAKLHTGRSRNDQVATDLRLWCKRELADVGRAGRRPAGGAARRGPTAAGDAYLPGYTHLQRAQPVLLAHHLLAHGWALARDVDRLLDDRRPPRRVAARRRRAGRLVAADRSRRRRPPSSASPRPFDNSLDAVSDRDFVAEALFDLALLGVHLSRIGEEWVLWTSEEFGFARLDDAYATGSSMLPQKKNPDIAELARGKAGRLIGNLTGLLATLKGLPLAYNRDLQEDKEPLFDSVDQVVARRSPRSAGMIATATFVPERMQAAADAETTAATDLAEWLVRRGMPFRDAHAVVGALVRRHLDEGRSLAELVGRRSRPRAGGRGARRPGVSVRRRTSPGGGGPEPVAAQLDAFRRSSPRCPTRPRVVAPNAGWRADPRRSASVCSERASLRASEPSSDGLRVTSAPSRRSVAGARGPSSALDVARHSHAARPKGAP